MRFEQRVYLVRKNLSQSPVRTALACMGVAAGMVIFLMGISVGWGIQFTVIKMLRETMPERLLTARRKTVDIGPLRIESGMITDQDAETLRAMDEVLDVWPQIPVTFPIRAVG